MKAVAKRGSDLGTSVAGFFIGLLFGATLTVIIGVAVYFGEKPSANNGKNNQCRLSPAHADFYTACDCLPEREPDFVASVHLLTPSWSEILENEHSLVFRKQVLHTEDMVDNIFEASDLSSFFNHSVVTAFRSDGSGVKAELQLYFVDGFHAMSSEVVDAFQFGFSTIQQFAETFLEVLDPNSFAIGSSGNGTSSTSTRWPDVHTTAPQLHTTSLQFHTTPPHFHTTPPQFHATGPQSHTTHPVTTPVPTFPVITPCGRARQFPKGQSGRVVGGTATDWYGVYPWVVMITLNGQHKCGGVIWDSQHVLTAAHCISDLPHLDSTNILVDTTTLAVVAGKWLYGPDPSWLNTQTVQVAAARMHRQYNSDNYDNDIAVLKLEHPLVLNSVVEPVCHPDGVGPLPSEGTVAGWGTTQEGVERPPEKLMEVTLRLYGPEDCSRVYGAWFDNGDINRYLHNGTFCAAKGLRGGADVCQGDGGGALFAQMSPPDETYTILGIVSNGYGCGRVGDPGFYVYVPYYLGWIHDSIYGVL